MESRMIMRHNLFGSLTSDEVDMIHDFSSVKEYQKNETIFHENRKATHVFLLLSGKVFLRLKGDDAHGDLNISHIEHGEFFGLSPLLGTDRYTSSAWCAENARALAIEIAALNKLLHRNPPMGFHILRQTAQIYFHRYTEVLKSLQKIVNQIPMIR